MWIALLLFSWGLEGVAGVWFCYHYWTLPGIHSSTGAFFIGPGEAVVQVWNDLLTGLYHTYAPSRHPSLLTQDGLARIFIVIYLVFHVLALVRGSLHLCENDTNWGSGCDRVAGKSSALNASLLRSSARRR